MRAKAMEPREAPGCLRDTRKANLAIGPPAQSCEDRARQMTLALRLPALHRRHFACRPGCRSITRKQHQGIYSLNRPASMPAAAIPEPEKILRRHDRELIRDVITIDHPCWGRSDRIADHRKAVRSSVTVRTACAAPLVRDASWPAVFLPYHSLITG